MPSNPRDECSSRLNAQLFARSTEPGHLLHGQRTEVRSQGTSYKTGLKATTPPLLGGDSALPGTLRSTSLRARSLVTDLFFSDDIGSVIASDTVGHRTSCRSSTAGFHEEDWEAMVDLPTHSLHRKICPRTFDILAGRLLYDTATKTLLECQYFHLRPTCLRGLKAGITQKCLINPIRDVSIVVFYRTVRQSAQHLLYEIVQDLLNISIAAELDTTLRHAATTNHLEATIAESSTLVDPVPDMVKRLSMEATHPQLPYLKPFGFGSQPGPPN